MSHRSSPHRTRPAPALVPVVAAVLLVMAATGCSGGDSAEASDDAASLPAASVSSFCSEFADVLVQDEPDFDRLKASAPEGVKPEVDAVVAYSKDAAGAAEPPDESTIEDFERSVAGMTIYAVDECNDIEQVVADLELDDGDLEVLQSYSIEDVRDDATWPTIKEQLGK
ncbi:MAG: hypothetical protein R2754_10550 [Microthrixaceae bacterium]